LRMLASCLEHERQTQAKPDGASPEVVRILSFEGPRMPFNRLPVQSNYIEIVF
jgi:hypothetical protein